MIAGKRAIPVKGRTTTIVRKKNSYYTSTQVVTYTIRVGTRKHFDIFRNAANRNDVYAYKCMYRR